MGEKEKVDTAIADTTMQARKGAIEAILALKDQMSALNAEEFLRTWMLVKSQGDNYCCSGCGPAYKGASDISEPIVRKNK